MNAKPMKTEVFVAKHGDTSWRLAVNAKRGREFAERQAAQFARNYALKHMMMGEVVLTSEVDGRSFKMTDFVCPVDPKAIDAWEAARATA